jgi:hypothetical protein
MKSHLAQLCVLLAIVWVPVAVLAQDTASITGTVTDPSGAAVANAQVTVSSPERGIIRTTSTNGSGEYLVAGLPPGAVDVSVSAKGFKRYEAKGVILRVADKARADVTLQVGAAKEEITVEGTNVAQVETQTNELAGTITGKEISQLQLNGRVFTQLVNLTPGVTNQTGSSEGQYGIYGNTNYSVNGGRLEYNNWEFDGGDNIDNGSNSTLNVTPSVDAIGEVRVLTSNYGAQYGRNASGTIETETKSGTSSFHGDAYEFVRNTAFNATPEFQSKTPSYHKNDYGYTIGGPIYIPGHYNSGKNKTFFFFSQEWRKDRVPGANFNVTVPSLPERGQAPTSTPGFADFTDICVASPSDCPNLNGANPAAIPIDSNAVPLLGLIPPPTDPTCLAPNCAFKAAPVTPQDWREELVRVDHNLTDKMRLMFRYAHDSWKTVTAVPLWTDGTTFPTIETNFVGPATALVARLTATASPTLLNEFMFSYTTDHIVLTSTGFPNPNAWKRGNYAGGNLFSQVNTKGMLPGISLVGGIYGGLAEDNGYVPNGPYNSNPTYTYRDNVTKIVGRHNLQFGAYFVAAQKNEFTGTNPSTNGLLTFSRTAPRTSGNPFADLLLGNIANFAQASAQAKYYNRYKILEPYFQDDFHATKKLTLNLGIRFSLFGTYRERYHQAFNFDPAAWSAASAPLVDDAAGAMTGQPGALYGGGNPFNGMVQCGKPGGPAFAPGFPNAAVGGNPNAGCEKGHLFNPAPRIGFAFDPRGDGRTAIRGGYGIFFEHTNGNEADTEALESSPPLVQVPTQYNIRGYTSIGPAAGSTPLLFPLSVVSIPDKAIWPYVQQWHFDIQHDVARNTVATISYVGSKGTHLGRKYELNQLHPVPASQNPYVQQGLGPISSADCASISESINGSGQVIPSASVNGVPASQQVAAHLAIACAVDVNPFLPFRGVGSITRLDNGAGSSYHALQAQLRRSVGALQVNVSYTYSHSIDDASDGGVFGDGGILNAYDFHAFRASSNFDERHLFTVSSVYDLPFFKGSGLGNRLLGGWQLSGIGTWQTGIPFNTYNTKANPDNAGLADAVAVVAGTGQSYADVISDPHANIPSRTGSQLAFGPFIANPNAFISPVGLTLGDTGRNFLRNPSRWNVDMALFKHFAIKERAAFEFRAEAFNIFNHVEWGPLGGDQGGAGGSCNNSCSSNTGKFGPANFLQPGAVYAQRILQLGLKFIF